MKTTTSAADRLIGYARVSTAGQDLDVQIKQLTGAGVSLRDIYTEKISGRKSGRPELASAIRATRAGDTFVVTKLDRLARSTKDLLEIVTELTERGVHFNVVTQAGLDTSTPMGKLFVTILAAIAEFEADLISARTKEALASRPPGKRGGRPRVLDKGKIALAQRLYDEGDLSMTQIAATVGVGRTTLYRNLEIRGDKPETA